MKTISLTENEARERLARVMIPEGDQYGIWSRSLEADEIDRIIVALVAPVFQRKDDID